METARIEHVCAGSRGDGNAAHSARTCGRVAVRVVCGVCSRYV